MDDFEPLNGDAIRELAIALCKEAGEDPDEPLPSPPGSLEIYVPRWSVWTWAAKDSIKEDQT